MVKNTFHNTIENTQKTSGGVLTPFLMTNVLDIPDIFSILVYEIFGNYRNNNKSTVRLISILYNLSFLNNIQSLEFAIPFCKLLQSKSLDDIEQFLFEYKKKPGLIRDSSIFRHDPNAIIDVFLTHKEIESATYFMRYVLHSLYLPDMNVFLEDYKKADNVLRDAMVPKTIYAWYEIE